MAHLAAMGASQWYLVLSLPTVLLILAFVLRGPAWTHLFVFSLSALVTGAGASLYNVYVLRDIDPKFFRAPDAALELEMAVLPVLVAIGTVVFGASFVALGRSRGRRLRSHSISATLALATLYSLVQLPLRNAMLAWAWILLLPMLCAWLLFSRVQVKTP